MGKGTRSERLKDRVSSKPTKRWEARADPEESSLPSTGMAGHIIQTSKRGDWRKEAVFEGVLLLQRT